MFPKMCDLQRIKMENRTELAQTISVLLDECEELGISPSQAVSILNEEQEKRTGCRLQFFRISIPIAVNFDFEGEHPMGNDQDFIYKHIYFIGNLPTKNVILNHYLNDEAKEWFLNVYLEGEDWDIKDFTTELEFGLLDKL